MGLCGSSTAGAGGAAAGGGGLGGMVTQGIQNYVMNLVVQRAAGQNSDTQFSFLKNLVGQAVPQAKITDQIVPNASSNLFNVVAGNEVVHNSQQSGPVQQNADSIISKLTAMAAKGITG